MKRFLQTFCAVLAIVAGAEGARAETLRIGGTGAAIEMLKLLGQGYVEEHPGTNVIVTPSLGSGGGIRAAGDGAIDIAVSGRPLTEKEKAGLTEIAVAKTPFVIVTSTKKPGDLKRDEVAAVYRGDKTTWADGTPIRFLLRPESEIDNDALASYFAAGPAIEAARKRQDVPVVGNDQDNAEMAERVPGSFTAMTYTQLTLEERRLRAVTIEGVAPSVAAYTSGTYPYARVIYLAVSKNPSPVVASFLDYVNSSRADAVFSQAGIVRN